MQPAQYAVPATMLLTDRHTSSKSVVPPTDDSHTRQPRNNACNACTHTPEKLNDFNSRTSRSQPTKQIVETSQQIVEPAQHRRGSVSCSQSETSVHVYVCTASQGKPSLTLSDIVHGLVSLASYSRSSSRTRSLISHALALSRSR